ncbi:hypothetical protein [Gellertiella hungarica]|uniref:Nitric oxide reductase NorF protein n=1 Tax=Gellertiella hungarica TaxID=1572859 RepID=A0A7W6J5Y6_9HYPH|nr:hypothetical protein [Gellertiella hungarica]MBB4065396.1 nitric oxide reductase NorF protein [Gellertiella hungarica]
MKTKTRDTLFASGNWILSLGTIAALLASQWKEAPLPAAVLVVIVIMTLAKSRLIILDFLGLRGVSPRLALPLYGFMAFGSGAALTAAFFGA